MAKQNYCEIQYTNFIWTVKHPNFYLGCDVCSPNFSVDSYGNARFYLQLISEKEKADHNCVSIYLVKHETYCGRVPIVFNVKLSVTDNDGNEYFFEDAVDFNTQRTALLEKNALFKKIKEYHSNSAFIFRLEIEPKDEAIEDGNLFACNRLDLEGLSSDMSKALKRRHFCDLTFRSIEGRQSVALHKSVLACRYPNLAANLNFGENSSEFNLGVDFDAIKMLTQYLYSGNLDTGSTTFGLHDILKRAELYHLEHVLYPTPRIIHASTSVPSKYGSFIWIIPKFSSLEDDEVLVNTLCFDPKQEWTKLRILLIKKDAKCEDSLALKIVRTEQVGKMYMLCKISFVGDEDSEYCKSYEHVFRTEREFVIKSFAKKKLIEEKKDSFLLNNTLKLRFEFIISDLKETSEYESVRCLEIKRGQFSLVTMNLWALQRDLKSLYLDPIFSDCTLQVKEELIPAHRVIIAARSPVFLKMFEGNTAENETGRIVIKDFSACVMKIMLRYIYCGELAEESKNHILDLYTAAHKYQVVQLSEKCAVFMVTQLNAKLVSYILRIADEYNDKYLKESVKTFVCCHAEEVFESIEWKNLRKERIDLTADIMNAALGSME